MMESILRVREYVRADGTNPYQRWFESLDPQAAAKVATAVSRLGIGNTSNVKWFAGIGERIIDWGPGLRVYLARDGTSVIILLGGGSKSTQRVDIRKAIEFHGEYKARKADAKRTRVKPRRGRPTGQQR
jgi:putative addiction module killer protein